MIAHLLSLMSALIWLMAGAPDSAPISLAKPKFSIYEITSPVPNQVVTDEVDIIGSVNSPGSRYFYVEARRIFVAETEWFYATLPGLHPVVDGRIGTFNTTSLPDGTYLMRLVVLDSYDSESKLNFGPIIVSNSQKVIPTPTPVARATATEPAPKPRANILTVFVESPSPGEILRDAVDIVGTVDGPDLRKFVIEFTSADRDWGGWLQATLRVGSVRSDVLGTWDTRVVKDGDYLLRINVLAGAEPRQYFPIGLFKVRNDA